MIRLAGRLSVRARVGGTASMVGFTLVVTAFAVCGLCRDAGLGFLSGNGSGPGVQFREPQR